MLAIRLPETVEKRLAKLAKATGRTKTFYAREAILEHMEDLEDLYLAKREVRAVKSGRAKAVPLAEAMKRHGMED